MQADPCLQQDLAYFPPNGRILDLACGDGRNAIYLAHLGYDVTAVDFSIEALKRLEYFSQLERLQLKTILADLSNQSTYTHLEFYNAIIINHYKLNTSFYPLLLNHLTPDGILWINGFSEVPPDNSYITSTDLIDQNELIAALSCPIEHLENYIIGERKFIRVIYRKQTDVTL